MVMVKLDAVTDFDGTDIGETGTSTKAPLEYQDPEYQMAFRETRDGGVVIPLGTKVDTIDPRDAFMKRVQG